MTRAWERAEHFELYDDALPVLDDLRARGVKIGLVSNTARDLDEFVRHHGLDVDTTLTSRVHGKTKPHETIFRAALERLGAEPGEAAMVGDSPDDDVAGARALGMRAFLIDRENRYADDPERLTDLRALPAALGLPTASG
jgi:putative hydrolase of the HAD superfamily